MKGKLSDTVLNQLNYSAMAEGFDSKQSDILRWIQSVQEASPDPPQEGLDRGLTSNPNFHMVFEALPAVPREHKALDKHLSAPSSDGISTRPRFASLSDVLPVKQRTKQPPHRSKAPAQERPGEQPTKGSRVKIKHCRQKSLSPLPNPTQKLALPAFNPKSCSEKKLFEPKPPLLAHCLLPMPGTSAPKPRLLKVSSDATEPKSAPVSPHLGSRRKEVIAGTDIRVPLRFGKLVREKSFSHDNLTKSDVFSDSDVSSRSSNNAAIFSDYNVSTVHSGDEGTGRETSIRATGERSPSLTITNSTHTGQASLTGKSSDARSEAGSSEAQPNSEGRLLQGDHHQLQDCDRPPVATSPSPLPQYPPPVTTTSPSPLPQYPPPVTTTRTPTPPEGKTTLSPTAAENRTLFPVSATIPSPIGWKQQQLPLFPSPSPVGWRQQQPLSSSSSPSPVGWKQQRPVSSSSSPSPTERPSLSPTQNPTPRATPLSHQKLQQLQLLEKMPSFQFLEEEEKPTARQQSIKFLSTRSPTFPPSRLHPTTRRPSDYSSVSSTSSSSGLEGSIPRRSSALGEDLITRATDRRLHLEKTDLQIENRGLHMKLGHNTSPLSGRRTHSQYLTTSPKLAPPVRHTNTETELFVRYRQQRQKDHVSRQDSGIGTLSNSTTSGKYDFR